MTDYFTSLGKLIQRELSVPPSRSRLGAEVHAALLRHISGPMARDQMPMMPSNGMDQEGGPISPPSPEELVTILRAVWRNYSPEEKNALASAVADLIGEPGDGELQITHMPGNGNGGRSNVPAGDRGYRGGRTAQDSALSSTGFARRWGALTSGVTTNGMGRM